MPPNIDVYTKEISKLSHSSLEEELRDVKDELVFYTDLHKKAEDSIFTLMAKKSVVENLLLEYDNDNPPF